MVSIEEVEEMLDEIAMTLPQVFYNKLNGGILLLPEVRMHPEGKGDDLYIMGQYHSDMNMGKYIIIYYGSFMEVYGHLPKEGLYNQLKKTLIHEFTHHLENLAGDRSLADRDRRELQQYKARGFFRKEKK